MSRANLYRGKTANHSGLAHHGRRAPTSELSFFTSTTQEPPMVNRSLVRNSSGQVNDAADDVIPFPAG